jgi:hypothetical protein
MDWRNGGTTAGLGVCGWKVVRVLGHVRRQLECAVAATWEGDRRHDGGRVERAVDVGIVEPVGRFPQRFRVEQLLADAQEQQPVSAMLVTVCNVRDLF